MADSVVLRSSEVGDRVSLVVEVGVDGRHRRGEATLDRWTWSVLRAFIFRGMEEKSQAPAGRKQPTAVSHTAAGATGAASRPQIEGTTPC